MEGSLYAQDVFLAKNLLLLNDQKSGRYWSCIALLNAMLLSLLASTMFAVSPFVVPYFLSSVKNVLITKAVEHVFLLLPAFWFHSIFRVLQKHILIDIQAQKKNRAANQHISTLWDDVQPHSILIFGSVLGLFCNILGTTFKYLHLSTMFLCWLFQFCLFSCNIRLCKYYFATAPGNYVFIFLAGMGFIGCGLSTSISRLVMMFYMAKLLRQRDDLDK